LRKEILKMPRRTESDLDESSMALEYEELME
jgi:hypothetical protein